MNTKTQQVVSTILAISSVVGLGVTIFLTAKAAPKAEKKLKEAEEKKGEKLSTKEVIKTSAKTYIPVAIAGTATAVSVISSTILSKKTEASLAATTVALDGIYRRYKGKVTDIFGKDAQKKIFSKIIEEDKPEDAPAVRTDGKKLYYNDYIGFFYAVPEKVKDAFANMNMRLNSSNADGYINPELMGYCTFGEFIDDCDGEILDKPTFEQYKNFGWSEYYLDDTWCTDTWIYLGEHDAEGPDDHYTCLTFISVDPIINPKEYDEERFRQDNDIDVVDPDIEDKKN